MNRCLSAVLAAFVAASPAMANENGDPFSTGDSWGPRMPRPETQDSTYGADRAKAAAYISEAAYAQLKSAGVTYEYEDRQPTVPEQLAASHAHDRRTYDRVVQDGGCNADFIPLYIAEFCNEQAFGNPMGSKGGD